MTETNMKLVELKTKIELLPDDWADNLVNAIIWGDKKHFYTPKKK